MTDEEPWLPVPARAKHDEPISAESYERREKAKREAEDNIAKVLTDSRERDGR